MSATQTNFQEKIALVTGGSRGIGRSTVENLAERGCRVIFTYHTRSAEADDTVAATKRAGTEAAALYLDTGDIASFDNFVKRLEGMLQGLGAARFDFLVNNAGNNHRNMPFAVATEDELDSIYRVHFKGVYFLTQKLLPLISDGGRIVNVSTARTRIISPGGSIYASMKGALEVFSRHLAKELSPRKIAVNVVAPGATETDFSGGIVRDNPEMNKRVAEATALGRAGVPDDVGRMIASLLSEDNHWINGERIEVTGGYI